MWVPNLAGWRVLFMEMDSVVYDSLCCSCFLCLPYHSTYANDSRCVPDLGRSEVWCQVVAEASGVFILMREYRRSKLGAPFGRDQCNDSMLNLVCLVEMIDTIRREERAVTLERNGFPVGTEHSFESS